MTSPAEPDAGRIVVDALGVALSALPADARIAIAYSGGLDSSVLLDAAVRVAGASRCVALHVHHGLSPNADAWLAHCGATARALGVAFDFRRVDVARDGAAGVEAAARDARYRALDAMCAAHGAQSLWLAQHADDQAETVLLQLLRGAGLAGLAAMAPMRSMAGGVPRVRPLLGLLRVQLEQYAAARGLNWVDDESNADVRYARNALRHDVMPALAAHFPGFRDALARTAAHAASAQQLLDELAQIDLLDASRDDGRALSHDALVALDDARALNLLRYWMRGLGLPAASAARLADALRQLRDVREVGGDHGLRVDHAGRRLRSYRGLVFWGDQDDDASVPDASREPAELAWQGQEVWRVPQWRGTFVFAPSDADDPDAAPEAVLTSAPLVARARTGGERMRDPAAGLGRTLKNLFQERGVPAWERDVPLLFVGDTLLFVPRIGVNRAALELGKDDAATAATTRWRRIEWREDLLIA
ncbi:tRNA lysidine(34) synthetase TilS [Paraburkholderia caballeronis]|uniref:tRNA(Ile)-lysidine synthase n=1 Tax=Paraburkholderia caballeronis TaxID=416943 RepID=A0A1H7N8H3_9BURK|nr:tRNA lysidine(34) synthetase TilS [Paraburkholderia caballeronis]PXW26220.1 tRNA(Ile)-lysidine synthase [Paraburkholderia caballeronis]PXX01767.1 tRNA(Ile)-lysidine synthase [Paraburkholderia caballeronis]RAK00924.1 tRNA(Ile)-lysidine synthase [Paraburkholderia caballeronis]SEC07818.1 tRNA(Ile)-lysidine synthase [Paraburkholderia caballeronis]SEL19803.1 tRNA(Ile)-lysidine synthase [Paraburkholderia caballeronis]